MNLPRLPELLTTPGDGSPVLMGVFRPAIVLPESVLAEGVTADVRLLLAHELAHWKRQDLLWSWLPSVVQILLWYHPVVWLAGKPWRLTQELACDEMALRATLAPPRDYGAVLVRVAARSRLTPQPALATVGIEESPETLKLRLSAIKSWSGERPASFGVAGALLCSSAAAAMVPWRLAERPVEPQGASLAIATPVPDRSGTRGVPPNPPVARKSAFRTGGETLPAVPMPISPPAAKSTATSPPATAARTNVRPESASIHYGWKPGKSYTYQVTVEAEGDGFRESGQGSLSYRPMSLAGEGGWAVAVNGSLSPLLRIPNMRTSAGGFPRHGNMGMVGRPTVPLFANGEVRIDRQGRTLSNSVDAPLPYCLGDLGRLLLVEFPEGHAFPLPWETRSERSVPEPEDIGGFRGPRFAGGVGPFGRNANRIAADERVRYRLAGLTDEMATLHRAYDVTTREQVNGEPRVRVTGEGTLVWDRREGCVLSLELRATYAESTPFGVTQTPIVLRCRAGAAAPQPSSAQKSQPPAPRMAARSVDLDHELAELKLGDKFRLMGSAGRLADAAPGPRREEVASALLPLLDNADGFVRQSAARALGTWGIEESVSPMIEAMEQDDSFAVQWAAMEALGKLRDRRAVEPLSKRILSGKDRAFASKAMAALGPIAEPGARRLLREQDGWVRLEACRILAAIGGPECVPELDAATRDSDGLVSQAARRALEEVRNRK